MSEALYWRPASAGKHRVGESQLRELVRDRKHIWDATDVCYLQGLADGGVAGAQQLIEAIAKHGEIELSIES